MQFTPWEAHFPPYDLAESSYEDLQALKATLETMQDRLHHLERTRRLAELQAGDHTLATPWLTRLTFHKSERLAMTVGAALLGLLLGLVSLLAIFLLSTRFL